VVYTLILALMAFGHQCGGHTAERNHSTPAVEYALRLTAGLAVEAPPDHDCLACQWQRTAVSTLLPRSVIGELPHAFAPVTAYAAPLIPCGSPLLLASRGPPLA